MGAEFRVEDKQGRRPSPFLEPDPAEQRLPCTGDDALKRDLNQPMKPVSAQAEQMARAWNGQYCVEGRTVSERVASYYRMNARIPSLAGEIKRMIESLPGSGGLGLRFYKSGAFKDPALEAGIVAEVAALEAGR